MDWNTAQVAIKMRPYLLRVQKFTGLRSSFCNGHFCLSPRLINSPSNSQGIKNQAKALCHFATSKSSKSSSGLVGSSATCSDQEP